jgi:hypothetical protein
MGIKPISAIAAALWIAAPVAAQTVSDGAGPMVITITKVDCSRLIQYQPSADVAYKPGVDVRGKPVVSADADPARAEFAKKVLPDVLEIPLTINPFNYGARKTANKQKADAASAVTANTQALTTAKAKATSLSSQLSDLTSEKAAVTTKYNAATAANVASTGGASATDKVLLLTRSTRQSAIDGTYNPQLTKLNDQITSVNSAITSNNSTIVTLQSQDTTLRQTYTDTNMATEGKLAGYSAKGLDSTQMKVGTVKFDLARNSFTFNGEPMISEDQQRLAAACARQGVR